MLLTPLLLTVAFAQDRPRSGAPELDGETGGTGEVDEAEPEPGACPARDTWPDPRWDTAAPDAAAVAALEAYAFPAPDPEDLYGRDRAGVRTDGVVITRGGRVVYERYARGYDADTPHLTWSVSKSYTNALTGRAVALGAVSLDDSICDHIEVPRQESCAITVRHLLEFSSGLDWKETYENEPPTASSVVAMLYGQGPADVASFIAGHPLRDPPGTTYAYSSGDTTLLAAVLKAALEGEHGPDYPWALLFDPTGVDSVTWERDQQGVLIGSSYVWSTPRDMARFGYLFLNDGCWRGERLLPEGWVAASTRVSEPVRTKRLYADSDDVQGRQWWLNIAVPETGAVQPWPDLPEDAFAALGHWKQSIMVIPSEDVVIARTGDDRDGSYDRNRFMRLALDVARSAEVQ